MENFERRLRHDIRGTFHALVLSAEVLRGALPPEECDLFLGQVVEACERIDELVGRAGFDEAAFEG